eukprot:TRINITY_DN52354_c0_g1_i1.p1 TRINITY_DN52354_c0_g1~~TRINITY_DN52354_c0_g1_i1.p1  ORF type:complete len:280 (-),score=19.15 TRINITY_DN52354_c0_g1_i1:161-949(-)
MSLNKRFRPADRFTSDAHDRRCDAEGQEELGAPTEQLAFCWRALYFYQAQVKQRPHITNAVVSTTLTTMADLTVQTMERSTGAREGPYNVPEVYSLAGTSFLYVAFLFTPWVLLMDRTLPQKGVRSAIGKLAASSLFFQPCVYVPCFFVVHGFLLGNTVDDIAGRFTNDYWPLLIRLWSLFMPSRFIMFWAIPVEYQVLWDCAVSFFWQILLTLFEEGHAGHALHLRNEGLVSSVMDFEAFGYLEPRKKGSPFLPHILSKAG